MESSHAWMIWPDNAFLSVLVLLLILIPIMYGARRPMHALLATVARAIGNPLRLSSRWLMSSADELHRRNKLVLLARGREEIAQSINKEFERVTHMVQRDLHGYPALQRKLMDEITRIEEEYQKCGEVPPPPPEWTKAVTALAKIKPSGDGLVEQILDDIRSSIDKIYDRVIAEYRRSYEKRHNILKGFMPFWRSVDQTLNRVDRNLNNLADSAATIDAQMEKYQQIVANSDKAEHTLASSATTLFFVSSLVLLIAAGGAFVNFWLIERPMAAMVGGGEYIVGDLQASHVAAMVIIFFETLMGLFLMEALGYTHLFPLSKVNNKMRRWMVWISFSILFVLAGVEVALAVMRDLIIAADMALKQELGGAAAAGAAAGSWVLKIPTAGQMILGFILPFALAFVAIPLEYFVHSARVVFGAGLVATIRALGFVARILSNGMKQLGKAMILLYDAIICVPLWVERAIVTRRGDKPALSGHDAGGVAAFPKRTATGERML